MSALFGFGERVEAHSVPVLNEREVRAGAGIMFAVAVVAFMNAWFAGDFTPTKLVIVAFLLDFTIRVLINPRWSPSLILGRIAVRGQRPELVGAPQKRFAWTIGLLLAGAMLWLVVIRDVRGPINLGICLLCLVLLFFESVFGICIGCRLHRLLSRKKTELCPGDACETREHSEIQRLSAGQVAAPVVFAVALWAVAPLLGGGTHRPMVPEAGAGRPVSPEEEARCRVPDFAKAIGHEEKWKLHNGCN
ncbi:MAG: DUF4395 domain-containing protein [Siculibacillus sp.]|nr:DUF4395 domain-containing protein [Siculibacillus sp.]